MDRVRTIHFEQLLQRHTLDKRVFAIYLLPGLVAVIPLGLYVSGQRWWLLPLIAIPIYAVELLNTVHAVRIAASSSSQSSDHSTVSWYDHVIGQWRSSTRYMWRRSAPLVLLKLGLGLGLAQWLHNVTWAISPFQARWWSNSCLLYTSDAADE